MWNELKSPFLILAPMEGVTDLVFRQVIKKAGRPDVFFTEFTNVSSYASEKGRENALERLKIGPDENPIVAQIWGKNPEHFAETASALEALGFDGLDINMGCPDKHVNKAGGGAAMIKTPELAVECIKCAKENTNLPVSVKTRLGFTYLDEYKEWLPKLLSQNLAALTVHLRTRKEMSKVPAHFELIPEIVKLKNQIAPETKLIINGDIKNQAQAKELHQKYPDIDGFMIGRGVFENPYCFTDHEPTPEELKNLFLYHLDLFEKYSRMPYETLKHFFKVYFKNQPGSAEFRNQLMSAKSTRELKSMIK
ncbi:tRNA-dihydrouridine synthase [Candidatus Saccharibacteria bacterium]|nr:tRNA-dihydrouridine synthase [Candidatus Saccharibacteria bacterium]